MLPEGWRFLFSPEAESYLSPGLMALEMSDTFRFKCVMSGHCCEHPAKGCKHPHRVGPIDWVLRDGMWRCPFLTDTKLCGIYPERPLVCRLFPVGVLVVPESKRVVLYTFRNNSMCPECFQGKKWKVSEWLAVCGFWARIGAVCREEEEKCGVAIP